MAKYTKKVSVGAYAKKGIDINQNDLITIANEGKQVEGTYGMQDVFLVKLASGEEKNINVNQTSLNGLIDAFGEDSMNWIGKKVKVWLISQNVAGKFLEVLYISHPFAKLTPDGFVVQTPNAVSKSPSTKPVLKSKPAPVVDEYPEGDIVSDDEEEIM